MACDVAVAKLQAHRYDLLISDLIVPLTLGDLAEVPFAVVRRDPLEGRYPGVWLIRFVREQMKLRLPIVVLTIVVGRDREPVEKLLSGHIQGYISKYDMLPSELCGRLRAIVEAPR